MCSARTCQMAGKKAQDSDSSTGLQDSRCQRGRASEHQSSSSLTRRDSERSLVEPRFARDLQHRRPTDLGRVRLAGAKIALQLCPCNLSALSSGAQRDVYKKRCRSTKGASCETRHLHRGL